MTTKPPDRRIQRTRTMLQEALFALIVEQGYEATTVQDIIDRANVGRSTFYAHFLDKHALFLYGFEALRESLMHQQAVARGAPLPLLGFSRGMFEHVHSHMHLYRPLVGKQSGAVVTEHIQQLVTDLVRDELAAHDRNDDGQIARELVVQYTVSAFMGILMWWADHADSYTPVQIEAIFQQMTLPGVRIGLGMDTQSSVEHRW